MSEADDGSGREISRDDDPDLEVELFRPVQPTRVVEVGMPARIVAGALGLGMIAGGAFFWIGALSILLEDGISWAGVEVAEFWVLGLLMLPALGAFLSRVAWCGRDLLQEAAAGKVAEVFERWSD